jgi:hypothetical protein
VALLFALQGAVMLVPYIRASRTAYETKQWPTTTGVVVWTQLRSVPSGFGKVQVSIAYEYRVGNSIFHSTQAYPAPVSPSLYRKKAEALVAGFPIGGTATVFYSPTNPQNAVLLPGITSQHVASLAGLSVWVVVPLVLVGWYWARRRARPAVIRQGGAA